MMFHNIEYCSGPEMGVPLPTRSKKNLNIFFPSKWPLPLLTYLENCRTQWTTRILNPVDQEHKLFIIQLIMRERLQEPVQQVSDRLSSLLRSCETERRQENSPHLSLAQQSTLVTIFLLQRQQQFIKLTEVVAAQICLQQCSDPNQSDVSIVSYQPIRD